MAAPLRDPSKNILPFQPKPGRENFRTEQFHTHAEQHVYALMYVRSERGTRQKRFSNGKLLEYSTYKDIRTIAKAVRGLLDKEHIELVASDKRTHYGTQYKILTPGEIWQLHQSPEYQERQAQKRKRAMIEDSDSDQPTGSIQAVPGNGNPNVEEHPPIENPAELEPENTESDNVNDSPSNAPTNAPSLVQKMHQPNENPPVENSQNLKPLDTKNAPSLVQKMHQPENFILIHDYNKPNNTNGGGLVTSRAYMREAEPEKRQGEKADAKPSGNSRREVVRQDYSDPRKTELSNADCERRAKSAERSALEKSLIYFLGLDEIHFDEYTKATVRRGVAWAERNKISAEEMLEYKNWWWSEGKTKPPKLDWLIETYPVFRGDISRRKQTGTAAAAPENSGVGEIENPQEPRVYVHSAFWQGCLEKIKAKVTEASFDTWFRPLNATQDDAGITLTAPDEVFADWLESNYQDVLEDVGLTKREWSFSV